MISTPSEFTQVSTSPIARMRTVSVLIVAPATEVRWVPMTGTLAVTRARQSKEIGETAMTVGPSSTSKPTSAVS